MYRIRPRSKIFQELAKKGIRIEQGEGDIYYRDGKGKSILSQKLGERYSVGGLSEQIRSNQVEQSSRQSYERKAWGKMISG